MNYMYTYIYVYIYVVLHQVAIGRMICSRKLRTNWSSTRPSSFGKLKSKTQSCTATCNQLSGS